LQEAGFSVKIIGRKLRDSIPLSGLAFKHKRISCLFNTSWLFYGEFNLRVFFCLLFSSQDAVCAVDLDTALPVLFISRLKRIPRVYDARELWTEVKNIVDRPRIQKIWKRIEQYCLPKFIHGYAVSTSIANELHKNYGVHFITIRNISILQNRKTKSIPDIDKSFLLYQGYVHEGRGIEALISAMQNIRMKLIICGTGNVLDECKRLAEKLKLEDKVIFKGLVPPSQLWEFTESAFIGLNLVEPVGLNQVYSLANKFFDYIHAELPQVTMNFPEYKNINDKYQIAILIDDIHPETITKSIDTLINDRDLYQKLKNNCRIAKEVLNWQQEEKKLVEFYQKVLN